MAFLSFCAILNSFQTQNSVFWACSFDYVDLSCYSDQFSDNDKNVFTQRMPFCTLGLKSETTPQLLISSVPGSNL